MGSRRRKSKNNQIKIFQYAYNLYNLTDSHKAQNIFYKRRKKNSKIHATQKDA